MVDTVLEMLALDYDDCADHGNGPGRADLRRAEITSEGLPLPPLANRGDTGVYPTAMPNN